MSHNNATPTTATSDTSNTSHKNSNNDINNETTQHQQYLQNKAKMILSLLDEPMIDLWSIRAYAISNGGLVNDTIRRKVWPKLVGLHERIWDFDTDSSSPPMNSTTENHTESMTSVTSKNQQPSFEESMVVTPKRSNVVVLGVSNTTEKASMKTNGNDTTDTATTATAVFETPNDPTKKVQDIFRSEVNYHRNTSSNTSRSIQTANQKKNKNDHFEMKDDAHSISSSGSYSSGASSALTMRHRNHTRHHHHSRVLASSIDATQIELDVLRCTWHLLTKSQKRSQQQYLVSISTATTTTAKTQTEDENTTTLLQPPQSQSNHRRKLRKIAKMIQRKQRRLSNLINLTLVQSSTTVEEDNHHSFSATSSSSNLLRYYQGYHDVACIILSTIGISTTYSRYVPPFAPKISAALPHHDPTLPTTITGFEMATSILYQLSQSHFRDCMRNNFSQLQIVMRLTIFPLLSYFDEEVHEHLMLSDMMEPYFALSWIITWFSHDIRDTELVKRLFDFFIVSHPIMPIYMTIAMICHPLNRQDVLQTEHDFSTVHQTLSQLPRNSSMVGWKYRPGDGYVSDDDDNTDDDHSSCDDDDMDDDLLSIGPMGSQSSVDTEFLLHEAATLKQSNRISGGQDRTGTSKFTSYTDSYVADAEAVSIVSSSMSSMYNARVPFQELMDLAIQYMERIPPKHLIALATRYYGREYVQKELASTTAAPSTKRNTSSNTGTNIRDDITFLQSPPTWTRSFTAHSDQTLKYYRTQQRRRNRSMSNEKENTMRPEATSQPPQNIEPDEIVSMYKLFQSNGDTGKLMAVIAAGYGIGDDMTDLLSRKRKQQQQRKRIIQAGTALAVMVVAIGIGYYLQQQNRNPTMLQPRSPKDATPRTVDNATCAADIAHDSLSKKLSNKMIATSSTPTSKVLTPLPTAGSRSGGKIMDMLHECTVRSRQLFERKCTTELGAQKINKRMIMSNPVRSNQKNDHMRTGDGKNAERQRLQQGLRELRIGSSVHYKQAFEGIVAVGKQVHAIGKTFLVSPMLDNVYKSKHLLAKTKKTVTQKAKYIQMRLALDDVPQQISEFLHTTYSDGVTRLKIGINIKKQSLAIQTTKVVNVAKSAMIYYSDDVVAVSNNAIDMRTSPPIIASLRKKFEPSDLNLLSVHLHSMLRNAVDFPMIDIQKMIKWSNVIDSTMGKLLTLSDASHHHITNIIDRIRKLKQSARFRQISESSRIIVEKVAESITSPGMLDAIRGASWLDHCDVFEQKHATEDVSKLKLEDDSFRHQAIRSSDEEIEAKHTRSGDDQCWSDLPLGKKKMLQFVKAANAL